MFEFVQSIPKSANLEWVKDPDFLHCFEAERLIAITDAMLAHGLREDSAFEVLDVGYLHGLISEFIHRRFPKATFTVIDHPNSPNFNNREYLDVIETRRYMRLLPCDIMDAGRLNKQFQLIILGELIEHLNPTVVADALQTMRTLISDNGLLIITTPNAAGLYNTYMTITDGDCVVLPPIPDSTMGYGHIHLWSAPVLERTAEWCGFTREKLFFNHGREAEKFVKARREWLSLKSQILIKGIELLGNWKPSLRGFFVASFAPKSPPNHAMQLTGSTRHGSCSPQTRRAATAPRSACS